MARAGNSVSTEVLLGRRILRNPIVAASGTFGHGAEFARLCPPSQLGAVTVKSLAHFAHEGNPPLRVTEAAGGGMLNSVGLSGPGVDAWIRDDLPGLQANGATIVASIWGRNIDDYAKAAAPLHALGVEALAAIEVNLSCPNVAAHGDTAMFAQSASDTAAVIRAVTGELPVFAKLTAQTEHLVAIATAALEAGAAGLTLINTLPGLVIDLDTRKPMLGAGGGGLSGTPLHPIALRCVSDVTRALPGAVVIGTGGVSRGEHAVAMLLAGATAVGVGTATFAEPRATIRIRDELVRWCVRHGVADVRELIGAVQWPK